MTRHTLVALSVLVSAVISGCSDSSSATSETALPVIASADDDEARLSEISVPFSDEGATIEILNISPDFEVVQFSNDIQNDDANGIFFDGSGILEDGYQLLLELRTTSKQTFENLNVSFAENTVPADILDCSSFNQDFNQSSVLYGYSCNDEIVETTLDQYGFPLFLITVEDEQRCSSLPLGAFNDTDCQISAFNFVSDGGLHGYYRSFRDVAGIFRESLTVTPENIPPFVDPTLVPGTCVLEVYSEGTVLFNDNNACTNVISDLLSELRT